MIKFKLEKAINYKKGGVAKVARRLNAHPLYLFQNKRLLVNRLSVIDKHLSHL